MAEVISTAQFKNGMAIAVDGDAYTIVEFQHVKPGKGGAFVRTKLKNLVSGAVVERTYRSGEKFTRMHTQSRRMQYLYQTDTEVVLMDEQSFEQVTVTPDMATAALRWVVENGAVDLMELDGKPFAVEPPTVVVLEITQADPGVRGDTAQGGAKPVTLETGVSIQVPLFIEQGERIKVDTRTGEYLSRA